jgi:hypothetical protein
VDFFFQIFRRLDLGGQGLLLFPTMEPWLDGKIVRRSNEFLFPPTLLTWGNSCSPKIIWTAPGMVSLKFSWNPSRMRIRYDLEFRELCTSSRLQHASTMHGPLNMSYGFAWDSETLWVGRYIPMVSELFPHLLEDRY